MSNNDLSKIKSPLDSTLNQEVVNENKGSSDKGKYIRSLLPIPLQNGSISELEFTYTQIMGNRMYKEMKL